MGIRQDDMVIHAEIEFDVPPDIWAVAKAELSAEEFNYLWLDCGARPLHPAVYVNYIEGVRQERK